MGAAPLILISDPDESCRKLINGLLRRIGMETIEAKTGLETLVLADALRPALVLLEVNLEEINGYEVCRELRDPSEDEIAIIFVSGQRTTSADRVAGLLVGADDYIVKPFDHDELLARVRAALRRVQIRPRREDDTVPPVDASLTSREREVLTLLAGGLNQAEIASKLFISPKTVGGHIQRIMAKLGVHSRAHAVALAHKLGLADVEAHALDAALLAS